jgi:magnesium chelatase family protein
MRRSLSVTFMDVKGHAAVKRAVEVAAAVGNNMIQLGPPAAAKRSRRLPPVLPPLAMEEAIETTNP